MPISSCRCGLPSPNASWVVAPAEVAQLDCKNWYDCPLVAGVGGRWGALGGSLGAGEVYGHYWATKALFPLTHALDPCSQHLYQRVPDVPTPRVPGPWALVGVEQLLCSLWWGHYGATSEL